MKIIVGTKRQSKPLRRTGLFFATVTLLLSSILIPLTPSIASADAATFLGGINSQYYGALFLRDCLAQMQDKQHILGDAAADPAKVFGSYAYNFQGGMDARTPNTGANVGRPFVPSTGTGSCSDGNLVTAALRAFTNLNSPKDYLNRIGYTAYNRTITLTQTGSVCGAGCTNEIQAVVYEITGNDKANDLIPNQIDAAKYYALQGVFASSCTLSSTITGKGVKVTQKQIVDDGSGKYVAKNVDMEFPEIVTTTTGMGGRTTVDTRGNADKQVTNYDYDKTGTCNQILDTINGLVDNVVKWDNNNKDNAVTTANVGAGKGGGDIRTEPECTAAGGTWDATTSTCTLAPEAGSATCTGGVLGWIMCPLVEIATGTINWAAPLIESELVIQPMVGGSPQTIALQAIWQIVVGIANLILVIAFLIVIFSQATSMGLSAYGIKKMLPRIIAAAILINLSFFICSIMLDVFNVIGGAIKGIIDTGIAALATATNNGTPANTAEIIGAQITWIVGIAAAAAVGVLGYLVPLLVSGALAVLGMTIVIGMRKVLILLLIVLAPLAFAAMILPGTEALFKKWFKSYIGLLAMYPVIMAILYGCALVSMIILAAG